MKHLRKCLGLMVVVLGLLLAFVLVGCGGGRSGQSTSETPLPESKQEEQATQSETKQDEPTAPKVEELKWAEYTLSLGEIESATASPGEKVEGKLVKVWFEYVADTKGHGGFYYGEGDELFATLKESKITLADSAGNTYEHTAAITVKVFKDNDWRSGGAEIQPNFALTFDVPKDISLDSLSLVVGGKTVSLKPYLPSEKK